MNQGNRRRALHEVVTLDGWYDQFSDSSKRSKLHVDVAFHEGRIGGDDPLSEVSFKLRLKRAEVVVVVPEQEPVAVDKASVSRDAPQQKVKRTQAIAAEETSDVGAELSVGLSAMGPFAKLAAKMAGRSSKKKKSSTVISENLDEMAVLQVRTADGHYAWRIEPSVGSVLIGRPWDANKKPRLKLKDLRPIASKSVEPEVNLEVRCRKEDLEISDIKLKNDSFESGPNNLIAAKIEIRNRLVGAGLLEEDVDHAYAVLTLYNVRVESR